MEFNLEQFKQGMKARTRDGRIATFVGICEKCNANSRLIAHIDDDYCTRSFYISGAAYMTQVSDFDLMSMVSPWEFVSIDTKVKVRESPEASWGYRHYAGIKDGKPTVWRNGKTSWTAKADSRCTWKFIELSGEIE